MKTVEVIERMELLGLSKNLRPISFKAFKEYADCRLYGRGKNRIYIVFCGMPKQNLISFYPPQTTKKESLEISYQYYLSLFEDLDNNEFTYGNVACTQRGYPLSYTLY